MTTRREYEGRRSGLGVWLLAICALWGAFGGGQPATASDKLPLLLQFSIQDEDGNFFHEGEIEFCTADGECLYADINQGFPGHFFLPTTELKPGVPYSVFVYDKAVNVLYEMRGWTFIPEEYDPEYYRIWDEDKFVVFPIFEAHRDRRLTFRLETTLNPEFERKGGLDPATVGPDSLPPFPRFMGAVEVPFLVGGKFSSDENAAGGVIEVKPGFGVRAFWRTHYPTALPERDGWVSFRVFSAAYQQNRYKTWEVYTPGRQSDVTFHRVTVSYGLGRMDQARSKHWSVSAAASVGGIFDGGKTLEYLDRKYQLFGLGGQARGIYQIYQNGHIKVGALGQAELMYYPGGSGDNDFWYGLAPSFSFGFVIY